MAVVVGRAEPAVDLGGGEDEAAPPAERHDLVHRHGFVGHARSVPGWLRRMPTIPVELHVVSDATGETAARLVQALEAQFPEQEFVEIRHPRVESEDDLQLAVNRMQGRPGGRRLHAREARAARDDAHALPAREAPLLRPARPSDRRGRARLGHGREDDSGLAAAAQLGVLPADGGDRVRRPLRRRRRPRPPRRRHRPRRRLADLEDAALDLSRLPRLQGGERPGGEGDRAAAGRCSRSTRRRSSGSRSTRTGSRRSGARACARWAEARATGSTRS